MEKFWQWAHARPGTWTHAEPFKKSLDLWKSWLCLDTNMILLTRVRWASILYSPTSLMRTYKCRSRVFVLWKCLYMYYRVRDCMNYGFWDQLNSTLCKLKAVWLYSAQLWCYQWQQRRIKFAMTNQGYLILWYCYFLFQRIWIWWCGGCELHRWRDDVHKPCLQYTGGWWWCHLQQGETQEC